ncbi:RagB/SusD family nutrient uptake outer membrane protein [Chitinophaga sp. YIM B06452]|uniref:RagB/SusD family nutrient uptake outer membrane protein n=1 Tax=Chitinophaga sp. YIM B06452 TaxID=3082158 RepID=UPI0031FF208D
MKKLPIYLVAALALGTSCNKDFLNRYPETAITPEVFWKTQEDLALYMNGQMDQWGMDIYRDSDQSTDNMSTTGVVEMKTVMTGTPTAVNITGGWDWGRLRNLNYFLENYERADAIREVKDHYAGLAKYYRAIFYYEKVKRFSDVPWYSKTIEPSDMAQLNKARDPRTLVVDSIMNDLAFASANVKERGAAEVLANTPDKWSAMIRYARIALHEGTFRRYHPELNLQNTAAGFLQKARDISLEIMNSGKFQVYNTGKPEADYGVLFNSQELSGNKEVILATAYDQNKQMGANINGTVFGDFECSPARSLVNEYLMKDGTRFTDIPGAMQQTFVQEFQNRDARLMHTVAYPGWKFVADAAPYIQKLNKKFTGYHQLKGYINSTDNILANSVDFPVYRYAEALLIYAEAQAELGLLTQADLDKSINLLRARAGVAAMNLAAANASPDPVLAAAYPQVSGAMKGAILEIRREFRVEFAMEGHRYDDLMRWAAGNLFAKIPQGMYFPGLGKYDMTGDGHEDIILIDKSATVPPDGSKEKNALGVRLVYYRAGTINDDATLYLSNGTSGYMVTETGTRKFEDPKFYYRPVPHSQVLLNPNLKQIFGW